MSLRLRLGLTLVYSELIVITLILLLNMAYFDLSHSKRYLSRACEASRIITSLLNIQSINLSNISDYYGLPDIDSITVTSLAGEYITNNYSESNNFIRVDSTLDTGAIVSINYSIDKLSGHVMEHTLISSLLSIFGSLVIAVVLWSTISKVVYTVVTVSNGIEKLITGITNPIKIDRSDELGTLVDSYNNLIHSIKNT